MRVDARPDRFDFRDLVYAPPLRSLPPQLPSNADMARFPAVLRRGRADPQPGQEGACTGFGLACVANYLLWRQHLALGGKAKLASSARACSTTWAGTTTNGRGRTMTVLLPRRPQGWRTKHGVCTRQALALRGWTPGASSLCRAPKPAGPRRHAPGRWACTTASTKQSIRHAGAHQTIGAIYVSATVHDGWDTLTVKKPRPAPRSPRRPELAGDPAGDDPPKRRPCVCPRRLSNDLGFIVQNSGAPWRGAGAWHPAL